MTKTVSELKPGDVLKVGDVKFTVKVAANLPNGKTTLMFEDMPNTPEYREAYEKLLKLMMEQAAMTNTEVLHGNI